jgi:outer membrane receptor for ferrienterochelin and colicin
MKIRHIAMAVAVALSSSYAMANTSSSIRGLVTTPEGMPAAGTKVVIVHVPTGSKSSIVTNAAGVYNAVGLRVGGPYRIEFDSDSYEDKTVNDVFLTLGETSNVNLKLEASGVERIAVVGARVSTLNLDATGPSSNFSALDIQATPSIARDIKNVIEQDPRITIDTTNTDAIQCAGGHNRSNSLTVDGLEMNDNFGLNSNGYPTERLPFPFDAIDQVAVELAPFDASYGNFTGCAINAVTKSGTNEVHGNVFMDYRNDSLQGDKAGDRDISVAPYSEKRYGFTVGAPIVEDKLFLFVAYEKHNPSTLFNFGPVGAGFASEIQGLDLATVNRIAEVAKSKYGYQVNPLATGADNEEEKLLAKLDWQINDDHRMFFTFQNTSGNTTATTDSGSTAFAFDDHFYTRQNDLTSYAVQFFSDWNENLSSSLRVSYQSVDNGQTPRSGQLNYGHFQLVDVQGVNDVFFGPDQFRHANKLKYDTLNLNGEVKYFLDDHELSAGFEYKKTDIFNMFVAGSNGVYTFSGLANFEAGIAQSISYTNAPSLNPADAAASFALPTTTLYAQDKFPIIDDVTLTLGLRYDSWSADNPPKANANFQTRYGFTNAQKLDVSLLQPRLAVNWVVDDTMVVYGGLGLFAGGSPNVWVSNIYSNDGVSALSSSTADSKMSAAERAIILNAANTQGFGYNIPSQLLDSKYFKGGDGNVQAISPDFKAASNWKFNIGTQKELTEDLVVGADAIFSKEKDPYIMQDLRLVKSGTAPDGRPIYRNSVVDVTNPTGTRVSRSNWDLLLTNSDESAKALILSTFADWTITEGLKLKAGYAYQDVEETHPMTSTTPNSNYDRYVSADPNNATPSTSNYETPQRFTLNLSYNVNLIGDYSTRFSLLGQRVEGRGYSYTFTGDPGFGDALGASRNRNLLYIPKVNDEKVIYSTPAVKDAFDAFIAANGLEGYRGQIAPRNGFNSSWWTRVDLKVTQEIPAFSAEHDAEIFFSVMNVGNLVNSDWGVKQQVGFPYVQSVARATINAEGKYVYSAFTAPRAESIEDRSSVWNAAIGIDYRF